MADRRPGEGRYAQLEREQRWLVATEPAGAEPVATIVDRYLLGTRLRLRRAERADGVDFKLGQKVRVAATDPERVRLTNIYLSADEYDVLLAVPAAELHKARSRVEWMGHPIAIDRFGGRLDGLVLAEVELSDDEPLLPLPPWAASDVTSDDRLSGGALAFATDDEAAALLRDVTATVNSLG